jgi:hypothetical protein
VYTLFWRFTGTFSNPLILDYNNTDHPDSMSSDETYLEAFIETLSTLPHEVRRNMDLIKDLDKASGVRGETLRQLQQQYIHQAEDKMMQLELVEREDGTHGVRVIDGTEVIIPTTYELVEYVQNAELERQIQQAQEDCLQKADEKIAIAQQALDRIDAVCQRLDHDLGAMELLLQNTGDFQSQETKTAKPNDLAACQITPESEWILAKVVTFDPQTGVYKLADEDVESNKLFTLPESQVIILYAIEKLRAGDSVYAVYPDTTSFYPATVVQAPRKASTPFVTVNFVDDSDEFGVTHDKFVPLKYTMPPPYGS